MTEIARHCQCDHCSGIDCGQDDPDRYLKQIREDEEKHDREIRAQVLEEVYKRLETIDTEGVDLGCDHIIQCIPWSDIDSLFAELKGKTT